MAGRPAWAEVSLSAIEGNIARIRAYVGAATQVCAVVKADAYGHGAVAVARAALRAGATRLAVALVSEGRELRAAGITAPILVLGAVRGDEAAACVGAGLEATVFDARGVADFEAAARAAGPGVRAELQLKLDTGMVRLGCAPEAAPELAWRIASSEGATLRGLYSHFADADGEDPAFTRRQLSAFLAASAAVEERGVHAPLKHIANSAGALYHPEARLDLVRVGIAMYGLRPARSRPFPCDGLEPALAVRARVVRVRELSAGESVSYGRIWTAARPTRVATVPLGYADGYHRSWSGRAWAGFGERRLPQIGRVCMDMCMFDATEAPELREGDVVTLAGPGGPSLDELAALSDTINYELACGFGLRLERRAAGD